MADRKMAVPYTKQLFRDTSGQDDFFEKSLEQELEGKRDRKAECLGMTFENDEEQRKYFLEKLRDKLKDPEFSKIEGFPIGSDEDILALSDQPYYTTCPNPFIEDFIKHYGKAVWRQFSKLGARWTILNDLSPAATRIAYNYNTPFDVNAFEWEAISILKEVEEQCGCLFETLHSGSGIMPAIKILNKAGWIPALQEFKQTRRDLPHWQYPGAILFVTFNTYQREEISQQAGDIGLEAIKYWHGSKMHLFSAVVMHNKAHMLFQLHASEVEQATELTLFALSGQMWLTGHPSE